MHQRKRAPRKRRGPNQKQARRNQHPVPHCETGKLRYVELGSARGRSDRPVKWKKTKSGSKASLSWRPPCVRVATTKVTQGINALWEDTPSGRGPESPERPVQFGNGQVLGARFQPDKFAETCKGGLHKKQVNCPAPQPYARKKLQKKTPRTT